MMAKFGPLTRSEDCAGVSGLDDRLMTHLLLEPIYVSGLLLLETVVEDVVVVALVVLAAGGIVVVVVVVVSLLLLLFCVCGRATHCIIEYGWGASIISLVIMMVSTFYE